MDKSVLTIFYIIRKESETYMHIQDVKYVISFLQNIFSRFQRLKQTQKLYIQK